MVLAAMIAAAMVVLMYRAAGVGGNLHVLHELPKLSFHASAVGARFYVRKFRWACAPKLCRRALGPPRARWRPSEGVMEHPRPRAGVARGPGETATHGGLPWRVGPAWLSQWRTRLA